MTVIQDLSSHITTPIQSQGRYFFKGDQRFLIKGVVYRLHGEGPLDPLVDDRLVELRRDITLFKKLGLNTLFISHVDSSRNHNAAMQLLADAGIYTLINLPTSSCTRGKSGTTITFRPYNLDLLQDCFKIIDCMAQYGNTIGIIVSSGAITTIYQTSLAPTIKNVIRDVKKYMATENGNTGQRQVPVGYSASTSRLNLRTTFDYFTAGKVDETLDFFSCADFNWCGHPTLNISGYSQALKIFDDAHIPIFFSQYGCNLGTCGTRVFEETLAIYSSSMTRVFSGGIAYEFYNSPDNSSGLRGYGLVRQEDSVVVGKGVTKLPDFESLRQKLENYHDGTYTAQKEMEEGIFKLPSPEDIRSVCSIFGFTNEAN